MPTLNSIKPSIFRQFIRHFSTQLVRISVVCTNLVPHPFRVALAIITVNVYALQLFLLILKGRIMKTLPSFLLLTLLSTVTLADNSLVVGAGQKITITAAQQSLTLDRFVMEDNSTIEFAPDVTRWDVFAREASFGNNTTINGRGHDGGNGSDGKAANISSDCSKASAVLNANNGEAGHNGVGIEMRLGITHFKSLQIDISGGNGGKGGKGASIQSSSACKGLAGGNGGNAGDGGNAGHVLIAYWSASQDGYIPISNYGTGIQITIDGGKASASGQGGEGTANSNTSKEIQHGAKAQSFGRDIVDPGKPGMPGMQGKNGSEGTFLVRPVTNADMAKQITYTPNKKM